VARHRGGAPVEAVKRKRNLDIEGGLKKAGGRKKPSAGNRAWRLSAEKVKEENLTLKRREGDRRGRAKNRNRRHCEGSAVAQRHGRTGVRRRSKRASLHQRRAAAHCAYGGAYNLAAHRLPRISLSSSRIGNGAFRLRLFCFLRSRDVRWRVKSYIMRRANGGSNAALTVRRQWRRRRGKKNEVIFKLTSAGNKRRRRKTSK